MTTKVHVSTNPTTQASLLTPWSNEANKAKSTQGFTRSSGTPFKVSTKSASGLVAVHRLYNRGTADFLWTKSASEVKKATASAGYRDEGVDFYASVASGACTTAVHRYVKKGIHRYPTSAAQRKTLASSGWKADGVAFYGATPGKSTSKTSSSKASSANAKEAAAAATTSSKRTTRPKTGPYAHPAFVWEKSKPYRAYREADNANTKKKLYQIASTSTSIWLGGYSTDAGVVEQTLDAAAKQKRTPQFVIYAIPGRDCGKYSAGGLNSVSDYRSWVDGIKRATSGRKAVFIVEPDAIGMSCLSKAKQEDRLTMLKYAMSQLQSKNTWTYLHAGSAGLDPDFAAAQLRKAGALKGRGFAVNVASFDTAAKEIAYGKSINKALGAKKHFVIDTSRAGVGKYTGSNGGAPKWCNPPGRAVGPRPTIYTPDRIVDAYLWIKIPGESDGNCHRGDPTSGAWFESYALSLVEKGLAKRTIGKI